MTATISPNEWLTFVKSEYLDTFIRDGGAAIKFAVPMDGLDANATKNLVKGAAMTSEYVVITVDAGTTRANMIDHVYFEVASQFPWRDSVARVVAGMAARQGYITPADGPEGLSHRLAERNDVDPQMISMDLRKMISAEVFKSPAMIKDFRVAMTQLAFAEMGGGQEGDIIFETIKDWLTGRNKSVAAVKRFLIFSKINRANARYFLESTLAWLTYAGYAGLVIVFDIQRLSVSRNPRDELFFYSRAAVVDTFELLRQFIDGIDRMKHCLMTVFPDTTFLDEDAAGRGIGAYEALKFRVYDEVRDRTLANPMASLVRLSETEAHVGG